MKIGDYVRTKDGCIFKPKDIYEDDDFYIFDDFFEYEKEDVKSSSNIIDLIQVGDYVNGEKVEAVSILGGFVNTCNNTIYQNKIKSIITHEQFESMEYKL